MILAPGSTRNSSISPLSFSWALITKLENADPADTETTAFVLQKEGWVRLVPCIRVILIGNASGFTVKVEIVYRPKREGAKLDQVIGVDKKLDTVNVPLVGWVPWKPSVEHVSAAEHRIVMSLVL